VAQIDLDVIARTAALLAGRKAGYEARRDQDEDARWESELNLTESHSLLAMAAVILPRCGNGIGWRRAAAGDVR
jgi:hypothetical protein